MKQYPCRIQLLTKSCGIHRMFMKLEHMASRKCKCLSSNYLIFMYRNTIVLFYMAIHIYTIFIFFVYRFLSIGSSLPANRNNMAWQSLPNPHLNQFAKKLEVDIFRTAKSKVRSVFLYIVVKIKTSINPI